jgi:hypothetical protein
MLQVDSKDVPNLEPIHIYIAGDKFTLKPDSYVVSLLSLNIKWERSENTHCIHILG